MKELTSNFKNIFTNHYADFKGRADRSEIWLFNAILYFIFLAIYMLLYPIIIMVTFTSALSNPSSMAPAFGVLVIYGIFFILMLPFLIPSLALGVRRLHDTNRSGWYLLLNLIPFFGGVFLTVLMCIDGDRGSNQYGEDPKIKIYSKQY